MNLAITYYDLAMFQMRRRRLDEAEQPLLAAVALDERLVSQFPERADYRGQLEHHQRFLIMLRVLRRTDLLNEGRRLQRAGRAREAERAFRRAISEIEERLTGGPKDRSASLKWEHAMALNSLAGHLAACPNPEARNPLEAIELARRAVDLEPQFGPYWNTLGLAYYAAGRWENAYAALERSIELRSGGDSFDWFPMAIIFWRRGDREEARRWYDRAVNWMAEKNSGDEELRRLRSEAAEVLGLPEVTNVGVESSP